MHGSREVRGEFAIYQHFIWGGGECRAMEPRNCSRWRTLSDPSILDYLTVLLHKLNQNLSVKPCHLSSNFGSDSVHENIPHETE